MQIRFRPPHVATLCDLERERRRERALAQCDARPTLERRDRGAPSRWFRHGRRGPGVECAGAAASVCAVWSPWRAPQPRSGSTPRYHRRLPEGGWDCLGEASSPLTVALIHRTPLPGQPRGRRRSAAAATPGPARAGPAWIAACGCAVHRGRRGFRAVQVFAGALWVGEPCASVSWGSTENKTPLPGYPENED